MSPQVNYPAQDYLHQTIQDLNNQVAALGRQGRGLPTVSSETASTLNTTSLTPVTLAGAPSVTTVLGNSADAIVFLSSTLEFLSSGQAAFVVLTIDGNDTGLGLQASATTLGGGGWEISCGTIVQLSQQAPAQDLSPGQHTFGLLFNTGPSGGTVSFVNTYLGVQPL